MPQLNSRDKGSLLERVIERLCGGIQGATITRNRKVIGRKSGAAREIDVWIEGRFHAFEVKMAIESKHYNSPVGIEKVEAFRSKLEDIGADLGVMVCPTGFTEPAKERAAFDRIQLFEVYDPELGNSNLFIPIRYIEPDIRQYSFQLSERTRGPFEIPSDMSRWRFKVDGAVFNAIELVTHAWNSGRIPQVAGEHIADLGAMIIFEVGAPDDVQYCEVKIFSRVAENYYLKLYPASFFRAVADQKESHNLRLDVWSSEAEMLAHGWKKFESREELDKAADIENQPESIRKLIFRPSYEITLGEG